MEVTFFHTLAVVAPLLLFTGSTRAGKSTLVAHLMQRRPDWHRVASCTTRLPRPGEVEGRDYHFLSEAQFETAARAGDFVEWQRAYGGYAYGLRRADLRSDMPVQMAIVHPSALARYQMLSPRTAVIRVEVSHAVLCARIRESSEHRIRLVGLGDELRACAAVTADLVVSGSGCLNSSAAAVERLAAALMRASKSPLSPQPDLLCP